MAASKTGLTRYISKDGKEIYAAKITKITPFTQAGAPPGSKTLHLEEMNKKSNLIGDWIMAHGPQVGGYFVAYDAGDGQTLCRHETAETMAQDYTVAS